MGRGLRWWLEAQATGNVWEGLRGLSQKVRVLKKAAHCRDPGLAREETLAL